MSQPPPESPPSLDGVLLVAGAFGWWGLMPVFWKWLAHVPPPDLLGHRITWAVPVFVAAAVVVGQGPGIARVFRDRRQLRWMLLSATLVAANWLVFLIAVVTDRVLHASLGYFMNPVLSTLLGAMLLRERLGVAQWASVLCAFLGVLWLTASLGAPPWIALALAGSFGLYGLVRKQAPVPPLAGSAVEVLLCAPFAIAWLLWEGSAPPDLATGGLLLCTGVVTAVPLILFAAGLPRIPLSTTGMLQYLAPGLQFVLAVAVFGEPFEASVHLPAFGLMWVGLVVFMAHAGRSPR